MEKVNPSFSVNCKLASIFAVVELHLLNIMEAVFRHLYVSPFQILFQIFADK